MHQQLPVYLCRENVAGQSELFVGGSFKVAVSRYRLIIRQASAEIAALSVPGVSFRRDRSLCLWI